MEVRTLTDNRTTQKTNEFSNMYVYFTKINRGRPHVLAKATWINWLSISLSHFNSWNLLLSHISSLLSIFVDWQKRRCSLTFWFMVLILAKWPLVIYSFRYALNLVVLLNQRKPLKVVFSQCKWIHNIFQQNQVHIEIYKYCMLFNGSFESFMVAIMTWMRRVWRYQRANQNP